MSNEPHTYVTRRCEARGWRRVSLPDANTLGQYWNLFLFSQLLIQQQRFDGFHTPACIVVQCSVGVGVTGQQTVYIGMTAWILPSLLFHFISVLMSLL